MNRLRFFKYLQLLLGISLLFSSVLPLNVIVFNAQLAQKLNETKLCNVKLKDPRSAENKDNRSNEVDDSENESGGEIEEMDVEDSWEDYDLACQCIESNCGCKLQAIADLAELERTLAESEMTTAEELNPFGFEQIHESNDDINQTEDPDVDTAKEVGKENRVPQTQKRKLLITMSVIQNDLRTVKCCQENCLHYVPLQTAVDCRVDFWSTKTQAEQRNFMLSAIRQCVVGENGRRFFRITTCEQDLCRKAWCTVYGIKDTRYKDVLKLLNEGVWRVSGKRCCFPSTAFTIARRWFKQFAFMSDVMPTTGAKHLPSCLSKRSIYMLYKEDMARRSENKKNVLSRTHFHRMWKKEFPNVKIPKQSRFTKCTICVHLKSQLLNSRLNKRQRIRLTNMRKVHLMQQMAERRNYYLHGIKAKQEPDKYLSLIMDGMDQNKTRLPHFTERTKVDDSLWKLKTHITGVLVDSRSRCYTYIDLCEYPHDPNLTIAILLEVLVKEQEKRKQLPPVLYLQMDNCGRENKNAAVIAFLGLLVKKGIFKKVRLGFLMVGHTHEDIDQMFSCLSRRLLKESAMTLEDLGDHIRKGYNPSPEVATVDYLPDVKNWMQPQIPPLAGHSEPHQFKIEKNGATGQVELHFRKWSTSKRWLPNQEAGEESIVLFESAVPKATPSHVHAELDTIIGSIKSDIPKYGCQFTPVQQQWWKAFLHNQEKRKRKGAPEGPWLLTDLKKTSAQASLPTASLLTEQDEQVHEELERRFSKERKEPKVRLKNKRSVTERKRKGSTETKKRSAGKKKRKTS